MKRNLDGVFFRIEQEDKSFDNVCFSDLTEEQMKEVLKDKDTEWLKSLCIRLGQVIHDLGEEFDICCD